MADLERVAKKYIHPDKLAVLVVGNGPEIKPGLDDLKPGADSSRGHHHSAAKTNSGGEETVSNKRIDGQQKGSKLAVVIMAAGKGTRLKSRRPKVLHEIGGKPLLSHVIAAASRLVAPADIYVVIGHQAERVKETVAATGVQFIEQTDQRGTGHAIQCAREAIAGYENVLVLSGDVPLIRHETSGAAMELPPGRTRRHDDPVGCS